MYNNSITTMALLLLFVSSALTAQNKEGELLQKISDECCVCMTEKIPISDSITSQELEVSVGICLLQICSKYEKELDEQGVAISDEGAFNKYAEQIGERMSQTCDHFLNIIFSLMKDENSNTSKEAMANDQSEVEIIFSQTTGTIKKINNDLFLRIWLAHDNGQDVFICLDNLKNPEKMSLLENHMDKKATILYETVSVYSPKEKKMIDMKKVYDINFSTE